MIVTLTNGRHTIAVRAVDVVSLRRDGDTIGLTVRSESESNPTESLRLTYSTEDNAHKAFHVTLDAWKAWLDGPKPQPYVRWDQGVARFNTDDPNATMLCSSPPQ